MVAAARKEREVADRRNDQLRAQLNETELLLATHQEQLAQLKDVMQQMSVHRQENELNTTSSTAPSTPALGTLDTMHRLDDSLPSPSTATDLENITPAPPTSFSHLLHPVLRTDLQAYDDFHTLLSLGRKSSPSSRVASGSFGSLSVTNITNLAAKEHQHTPNRFPSNGSTSSLSNSATFSSSPITPLSANSSVGSRDISISAAALKETRFYKRALTEDIEPTLRLDTAPGLSWLARRTVVNSMSEGSLVVEPMPAAIRHNVFACSLCGENRKGEEYARTHRFRTSENDNAQRYPLCGFCLNRVRASCDFLGFLRMLKDGHWRADDDEAEFQAWEECVKLRERMFWARIGGGVVPTVLRSRASPRTSMEHDHSSSTGAIQGVGRLDGEQYAPQRSGDKSYLKENEAATVQAAASIHQEHAGPGDKIAEPDAYAQPTAHSEGLDHETAAAEQLHKDLQSTLTEVYQDLGIEDTQPAPRGHAAKDSVTSMPGAFE